MFPVSRLFTTIPCPDRTSCQLNPCLFSHSILPTLKRSHPIPTLTTTTQPPAKVIKREVNTVAQASAKASANTGASKSNAVASTSKISASVTSTAPRLDLNLRDTHSPISTRNSMLTALHTQFLLTYSLLPLRRAQYCAHRDALAQELENYTKSNKVTYRNASISSLARLKKRERVMHERDTGTLEQENTRLVEKKEKEKRAIRREKVKKFISSKEVLRVFDYVVDLPQGVGGEQMTEEGRVRKCDRCGVEFLVKGGLDDKDKSTCSYHYGKLVTEKLGGVKSRVFSCCPGAELNARPCQRGPHVFRDEKIDILHSRIAFVETASLFSVVGSGKQKHDIVALDCEMVYTTSGLSLARLTVVDVDGAVLLDSLVQPPGTILDVNTRFSGIAVNGLQGVTDDLGEVRELLGGLIDEQTIIVGHGLENDLKALRLVHTNVIDTAIIFPHPRGVPMRHSLRNLSRDILGKLIQDSLAGTGHSSVDDSIAALELLRWKMIQ